MLVLNYLKRYLFGLKSVFFFLFLLKKSWVFFSKNSASFNFFSKIGWNSCGNYFLLKLDWWTPEMILVFMSRFTFMQTGSTQHSVLSWSLPLPSQPTTNMSSAIPNTFGSSLNISSLFFLKHVTSCQSFVSVFISICICICIHRTCENMHWGVGLGGLSMPNGWCTLCMPIYFKCWGIKKYSIPYMVQIELTYIPIKCGIVNPYVDGFLNSSGNAMVLPLYYLEVVLCDCLASDATVVVYRGGFLQVFLESFVKFPGGIPYTFLITHKLLLPLKWVCMPYLPQVFLMLLHRPWV